MASAISWAEPRTSLRDVACTAWLDGKRLGRHHAIVRRELARHHGLELETAGDGFFAVFDGPARAVQAPALRDPQRAIGIEVRAGVHTGECEVSDSEDRGEHRLKGIAEAWRLLALAG